ncbi:MAG: hypothetical protein P8N51_13690 [Pseudomonadales bacterium]|nr:hypothetical protein [Pseudomonadales bacterium]MDG1444303.1 hypothetical protein [Pseudomonadales bacterium]
MPESSEAFEPLDGLGSRMIVTSDSEGNSDSGLSSAGHACLTTVAAFSSSSIASCAAEYGGLIFVLSSLGS